MNHEQSPTSTETPTGLWQPDEEVGDIYLVEIGADGQIEQAERMADVPRIWVASLVDYTNGTLHGTWLDAAREPDEIQADIQSMLARSPWTARTGEPAEEWGIFDFDNFGACQLDEYEDIAWVSAVATGIRQHGLAYAAWANVIDEREHLADFDEAYLGHYDDLHSYVEQMINDLGYDELLDKAVPASIRPYVKIDITATANDLVLGGDLQAVPASEGGVWIFNAR